MKINTANTISNGVGDKFLILSFLKEMEINKENYQDYDLSNLEF